MREDQGLAGKRGGERVKVQVPEPAAAEGLLVCSEHRNDGRAE